MMMNKLAPLLLAAGCFACLLFPRCAPAQEAAVKAADPQNVWDYFLLLTKDEASVLEYTDAKKTRQSLVKTMDVANGFLSLSDDDLQGRTQIVLFRKKDRSALIAVSQIEETVATSGGVRFFRYRDGKWEDVTAEVLPEVADEEILAAYNRIKKGDDEARTLQNLPSKYWELPEHGTTVELRCGEDSDAKGKTLMRFTWNGARLTKSDRASRK